MLISIIEHFNNSFIVEYYEIIFCKKYNLFRPLIGNEKTEFFMFLVFVLIYFLDTMLG